MSTLIRVATTITPRPPTAPLAGWLVNAALAVVPSGPPIGTLSLLGVGRGLAWIVGPLCQEFTEGGAWRMG